LKIATNKKKINAYCHDVNVESPLTPSKTPKDLIEDIERLHKEMFEISSDMIYYGGFTGLTEKADCLLNASYMMRHWAQSMKKEIESDHNKKFR